MNDTLISIIFWYFSDPLWAAIDHHLIEIEGETRRDDVEDPRKGENLGQDLGKESGELSVLYARL